ncbi:hypothetical protein PHLCEN_2v6788 [Hermanssonia centrifuga]|uniref:Uncharacterized protein n=1 Tax=Hermanssonia centrifuga TaxID=98765 RepID=A0A2R6NYH2_9APHY|nr:hypothetical protein PHLCEN_2v6788 [Hermanssonia centrifuga]
MADAHKNIKKSVAAHGRSDGDTSRRDLGKRREIVPAQDKVAEKTKTQRTAFLESQELMTDAIEAMHVEYPEIFVGYDMENYVRQGFELLHENGVEAMTEAEAGSSTLPTWEAISLDLTGL